MSGIQPPPLPEKKSVTRRRTEETIEATAAGVPFAGGVLAVKYGHAFRAADERRIAVWREQVTECLDELAERVNGLSVEALFEDDEFVDALAAAARIAEKSSADDKRRALQNALFNIGAGNAPDADRNTIYLRYIEELTPSHLMLLRFMHDPPGYFVAAGLAWPDVMGGLGSILKSVFPAWAKDAAGFLDTLMGDLDRLGLVSSPGLGTMMTGTGLRQSRTTTKGREFMAFITGPMGEQAARP